MSSSNNLIVNKSKPFLGKVIIPGDKSISHRSIILGSLAKGKLTITNFLKSDDCLQTISAMRSLGAKITNFKEQIINYKHTQNILIISNMNQSDILGNRRQPVRFSQSSLEARFLIPS